MKRVFVKRILRLSSVSRLMQPGDESLLMRSTNGSGQLFYASQFNPLNDNLFLSKQPEPPHSTRHTGERSLEPPPRERGRMHTILGVNGAIGAELYRALHTAGRPIRLVAEGSSPWPMPR